ncbi:MAG: hypothetical protein AB1657_04355 [Candidatus Micrarchaeota archaeon]
MDSGYFVSESITRGALSRNYAAAGPSAARGAWIDIINFSLKKRAPVFAEIEQGAYYIGVMPPVKKGEKGWKKPLEEMVRFSGRKISGPATILHFGDIMKNEEEAEEPPWKWLPKSFAGPVRKGLFGTYILLSFPYMSSYAERCLEELGASNAGIDYEKGEISFEFRGKSFSLDFAGLVKKMAYGGYTKEFLAAALLAYAHYDSERRPGLNLVRRVDFPREKGIYIK